MADEVAIEFLHMEMVNYVETELPDDKKKLTLDSIGYRVGYSLAERLSKETLRFKDDIDSVKFICRELWNFIYKKQVDNLRTNHSGVYVLVDNHFRFISSMAEGQQYLKLAAVYLYYSCGLIRGALECFGLKCTVTADMSSVPVCRFHIKVLT